MHTYISVTRFLTLFFIVLEYMVCTYNVSLMLVLFSILLISMYELVYGWRMTVLYFFFFAGDT